MVNGRRPHPGQVRIIAGTWRGRRLPVPDRPDLRPTPDRLRETLFNWLHPLLPGAACLDLFAGTGILGFEAASRGAAQVVLVDSNAGQVALLRQTAQQLGAEGIEIHCADALTWLAQTQQVFDIIFLDPPFDSSLLQPGLALIVTRAMLRVNGLVYIEGLDGDLAPPPGWTIHKQTRAGRVAAMLIRPAPDDDH